MEEESVRLLEPFEVSGHGQGGAIEILFITGCTMGLSV
jgi:hypothetical protein